ncbi:hypothetical protein P875_00128007 [Aspergillus parasiticus SU-1]|uniref:Uncharacterized protein n=1 Tax=Aspergillus parasiticus (strain ATCC 56775 / NRRL 5862 / SRRC 143 / SU-1) TaxID=1403190 RepID=A0A0F0IG60_ASPPU|nr:hypothetical protein P875_00128007 [Aspergillus parasiticus SU-1]
MPPLSDNDRLFESVLPYLFDKEKDTFKFIEADVKESDSLHSAIESLAHDRQIPETDKEKLSIFSSLLELLDSRGIIAVFDAKRKERDIAFIEAPEDLIELIAGLPDDAVPSSVAAIWPQVRRQLLEENPTATLIGLLRSNVILEPASLNGKVSTLLRIASRELRLNISKDSIRRCFNDKEKRDKIEELAGIGEADFGACLSFLTQIQELLALVYQPEDIGALVKLGFVSPETIARVKTQAVDKMTKEGIPSARAERIFGHALAIDLRRERLWVDALVARGTSGIADVALAATEVDSPPAAGSDADEPTDGEINLSTIFDLESIGCVDCGSVLSPAAYYVYLLEELDKIKCGEKASLLDKLMERRADLGTLELSCSNTKIPIPYIDLVNEVLESALARAANLPDTPFNMGSNDEENTYLAQPKTTNYTVYKGAVLSMVFPMDVFPYNQAIHSTRALLTASGVSRSRLLTTLGSVNRIMKTGKVEEGDARSILDRAISAEILGLQHEDYVSIVKEGFYTYSQLKKRSPSLTEEGYQKQIGLKNTCEYWGYEGDAEMTGPSGLSNIKTHILPRSGLSFLDFMTLLKTRFIGRRLVILSKAQTLEFDGSTENMRLWQIPLQDKDAKQNIIDPSMCDQVQGFLRLQRKLGWSIEDLDAYYCTLAGSRSIPLDAQFLNDLAAAKQLVTLTNLEPAELQPLWGDMNAHGERSLYTKLFCQTNAADKDVFRGPAIAEGSLKISHHLDRVMAGLSISAAEYESIMEVARIPDQLCLENLSRLYRISLLCKVLEISPLEYQGLLSLYDYGFDFFKDPATTLSVVKQFSPDQTPAPRWTLAELLFVIRRVPSSVDDSTNPTIEKKIEAAASVLSALMPYGTNGGKVDEANLGVQVTRLCTRLFGPDKGQRLVDFLEDPARTRKNVPRMHDLFVEYLNRFLGEKSARSLLEDLTLKDKSATDKVNSRRRAFIDTLSPVIDRATKKEVIMVSLSSFLPNISSTMLQFAISEMITVREKDSSGKMSVKSGMESLLEQGETSPASIKGYDGYFLPPKTDVYTFTTATGQEKPPTLQIDGETLPFSTSESNLLTATSRRLMSGTWYRLQYTGDVSQFKWAAQSVIGVAPVGFTDENLVDAQVVLRIGSILESVMQISLIIDRMALQETEIEFWQTARIFNFTALSLYDIERLEQYRQLKGQFSQASAEKTLLELYRWLYGTHDSQQGTLAENIESVTGWPERTCSRLLEAKYPALDENARRELFKDITVLFQMSETLKFVDRLNLPSMSLESLLNLAEPSIPLSTGATAEKDFQNAAALRSALQGKMSPASIRSGPTAFSAANDQIRQGQRGALVQCLLTDKYRVHQYVTTPEKLFGYFLCDVEMGSQFQTSRIKQAISTVQLFIQRCLLGAEDMYDIKDTTRELLMDLDLESMMRYRLWEAKRKSFLYPENWLDPSLRDDKTEQFKLVESAVMEKKLDMDTIGTLIQGYLYGVNEVADIQVEAYLWERKDKTSKRSRGSQKGFQKEEIDYTSAFHLFGRTRTSPATHYYRKLELQGSTFNQITYWDPWTKMDVDIPVNELDDAGNKLPRTGSYLVPAVFHGRLFVFLPDILARKEESKEKPATPLAQPASAVDEKPGDIVKFLEKNVRKSTPKYRWEIRMGFIEYQNGKWSNRKVSQSVLYIPQEDYQLPNISGFQFHIDTRTDNVESDAVLRVRVCRTGQCLGVFEMRGQQLLLVDSDQYPVDSVTARSVLRTVNPNIEFSKLINRDGKSWNVGESPDFASLDPPPILPEKRERDNTVMAHSLVVSFDDINYKATTGFVLEVCDKEDFRTLFLFPPFRREYDPQRKGLLKGDNLDEENMNDYINPMLLKKLGDGKGLKPLYDTIRGFKYSETTTGAPADDYSHDIFGRRNTVLPHERSTPFAIYNWELGVHIPSLLIERLLATHQYELALTVARLVFDPTIVGGKVEEAWSFPPFRSRQVRTGKGAAFDLEWQKSISKHEWLERKGNVHAAARGMPRAYMLRIAMKYIEILIAAGDEQFRLNTLESIPLALQRYIEASQVFGPQPATIPRLGKTASMSYNQVKGHIDADRNWNVRLGLEFPFFGLPGRNDQPVPVPNDRNLGFMKTGYFCVPANPALMQLRNLIDDRLYNIRNGMDINGRKRILPLFDAPIDPGALMQSNGGSRGTALGSLLGGLESPMPKCRFSYLIQQAYSLINELEGTAQQLLSIREKKDAEGLSAIRYKHQRSVLAWTTKVKEQQKKEIQKAREVLEASRRQQQMHLEYFLRLTGENKAVPQPGEQWEDIQISIEAPTKDDLRMSPYENMESLSSELASALNANVSNLEASASELLNIPTITMNVQPWGVGLSTGLGGETLGRIVQTKASRLRTNALAASDNASRAARKSALSRQLQERLFQANTAGRELMRIDKDLEQLQTRIESVDLEVKTQQQEAENVAVEEEWMKRKYTNQQLYTVLDNSVSQILQQTYTLALDMAKVARRALDFEHAMRFPDSSITSQPPTTIGGYWENSIDGLTSAKSLILDLKRMEICHMENSTHDFEITKAISLRQLDPLSLIQLQETGSAKMTLDEALFDMDYPGHYCRRISSVALTIPCILGAYTSVNCTLTLLQHRYRVSPLVKDAKTLYLKEDGKYRTDQIPITSIAVSNGVQDTGSFSLDFRSSNTYGPFEGAGVLSDWQITLPTKHKQFDYRTISDVVMHLRYTSVDSSGRLKVAAETAVDSVEAPPLAINLKNDYPSEWYQALSATAGSKSIMKLGGLRERMPFWTRNKKTVKASSVTLLVYPAVPKATLKSTNTSSPQLTLNVNKQASVGNYTALKADSGTFPALDQMWELSTERTALQRGWLLIEYSAK